MTLPNPQALPDLERLRELMRRAEPLPWVWEQCGDKVDAPVVGVAFDAEDKPLAGELCEYGEEVIRFNIASDLGSGIAPSAPSANAAFIVEAVNSLPALLARIEGLEAGLKEAQVAIDYAAERLWNQRPAAIRDRPEHIDKALRAVRALLQSEDKS